MVACLYFLIGAKLTLAVVAGPGNKGKPVERSTDIEQKITVLIPGH